MIRQASQSHYELQTSLYTSGRLRSTQDLAPIRLITGKWYHPKFITLRTEVVFSFPRYIILSFQLQLPSLLLFSSPRVICHTQ